MERSAISIDTNGSVCGALVQFGCYLHRHKWMSLRPIHIRLSLEVTRATHYIHQLYFSEGIFVISTLTFVFLSTNANPIPTSGLIYSLMLQLRTCLVYWLMELCIVLAHGHLNTEINVYMFVSNATKKLLLTMKLMVALTPLVRATWIVTSELVITSGSARCKMANGKWIRSCHQRVTPP